MVLIQENGSVIDSSLVGEEVIETPLRNSNYQPLPNAHSTPVIDLLPGSVDTDALRDDNPNGL